jgi:hypothetical protein
MRYSNYYLTLGALLVFTTLEILCQIYWLQHYDRGAITLYYMLFGLMVGFLPLWKVKRPPAAAGPSSRIVWTVLTIVLLCFSYQTIVISSGMMARIPVDYRLADMLPIMQIMSQRYVNGEEVYDIIPEIWGGMQPIYLPGMWMPYIPSVIWHFDPRWVTVFFLLTSSVLILLWPPARKRLSWCSLLVLIPMFFLFRTFLLWDFQMISLTDEGVVIGFYVFLAWAIWFGNPWVLGIALALSILSRVSYLNWIPFYAIFVWVFESRRKALITAGTAITIGLFLMVVSQAIFHLEVFLALPKRYLEAMMDPQHYQNSLEKISATQGFAKFFRQEYFPLLLTSSYVTTIGAPLLCLLAFRRLRHRMDANFFGLATLKITLVFFFNLIIMPQSNLFYTSGFLSLAILAFYAQTGRVNKEQAVLPECT